MSPQEQLGHYWFVSRIWHGRSKAKMTVDQAIKLLTNITKYCSPRSVMFQRANALLDDIIHRNIDPKSAAAADADE